MPKLESLATSLMPPELVDIMERAPLPGLDASPHCATTAEAIEAYLRLPIGQELPKTCQAGLWLLAGDLDRSHSLSQSIDTPDGSFWHAIMHRREGDFWNAKYWFRRTTNHPVHKLLAEKILNARVELSHPGFPTGQLTKRESIAEAMVDCCELATKSPTPWRDPLQLIGWWEWQLLFAHSRSG